MGFTVYHPGGNADSEFEAYLRLLRQNGIDLGNTPRVPEPGTNNKWLYVWDSEELAKNFRDELVERTADSAWETVRVSTEPSHGPLGPILVQMMQSAEGLNFSIHTLTRSMIRSAFPEAAPTASTVSVDFDTWNDFKTVHGGLLELVLNILPSLTGLNESQIESLGVQIHDADTDRIVHVVPPNFTPMPSLK